MQLLLSAAVLAAHALFGSSTSGEGSLMMPEPLKRAELEERAGAHLPLDIALTDHNGRTLLLKEYFSPSDRRPVILTLGYYGCPMLCSLVLNGLVDVLKKVSFQAGRDFRIVSASIDSREGVELARRKRKAYLEAIGIKEESDHWSFHVMSEGDAKRLAGAVGFNYFYDKKADQFAHGAGIFVISPDGILSRTLFGITFAASDIKLALSEAADGKIGTFVDRVIMSCFHYDPDSHRYGLYIMGAMRLAGLLTILVLGMVLAMYFRGERRRGMSAS